MAQVEITVNERLYKVTCDDGQEERLQQLAGYFNRHVSQLAEELGQIGETRLMLLTALTISDELFDARERCAKLEKAAKTLDSETEGGAKRVIETATARAVDSVVVTWFT